MSSIKQSLINKDFFHDFQPIYDIFSWKKIGHESLLRSTSKQDPKIIFEKAKEEKWLYQLDSWSIDKAAHTYQQKGLLKKQGCLFVNIFPSTILNENFPSFVNKMMDDYTFESKQIVFEISESENIFQVATFNERVNELKKLGFLIAIDDMGKDQSCLKLIVDTEPHFIKLDRYFAENLHLSEKKQMIINLILNYGQQFGSKLILEGVETPTEMAIAKALGVPYCQGYILGKPEGLPKVQPEYNYHYLYNL